VDLEGITSRPTHMLSSKYNMITRLQNPPDDGINYIQVFRRQIGRRHALIEYRDFSFWINDQNSVNGTWLNGERVLHETRLKHGDRLRFHVYEFEFCVSDLALSNETLVGQGQASAS
jgi:pSer/pThr/pTyr-binding forkhead associated (FHA) protein